MQFNIIGDIDSGSACEADTIQSRVFNLLANAVEEFTRSCSLLADIRARNTRSRVGAQRSEHDRGFQRTLCIERLEYSIKGMDGGGHLLCDDDT
jgi:hypothetical protein